MADEMRLVLKASWSFRRFRVFAWDSNWDATEIEKEEGGSLINVWETDDERTWIRLVDDQPIGMRYVYVSGEGRDRVVAEITAACDLWTYPEARSALAVAAERDGKLIGVYASVLTAPPAEDSSLVEDFRNVSRDEDPGVRQSVVIATGYLPWSGLIEIVEEVRASDPEDFIRENAEILLEGIRLDQEGEL